MITFKYDSLIYLIFIYSSGPISLALYLTDTEADLLDSFVTSSDCVRARKNIGYHIVYKQGVRAVK